MKNVISKIFVILLITFFFVPAAAGHLPKSQRNRRLLRFILRPKRFIIRIPM